MKEINQTVMQLIRANKKNALAGIALLLAVLVGFSSAFNYVYASFAKPSSQSVETPKMAVAHVVALTVDDARQASIEQIALTGTQAAKRLNLFEVYKLVNSQPVLFDAPKRCAVLSVDDRVIAYFRTEEEANFVLENIKSSYNNEQLLSLQFAEDVDVAYRDVSLYQFSEYSTPELTEDFIRTGTREKREYVIVQGDTISGIAEKSNLTQDEIYAANPQLKEQRYLQIDQVLNLVVPVPIINVVSSEQIEYTENVAFNVLEENNAGMYKGEKSVKRSGEQGVTAFVATVEKVNGIVQSQTIVSEEVVKEPVDKILFVGTKDPPPTIGTGVFGRPAAGYMITSRFGVWRGSSRHTGIDLAMPYGTPIYAADGGVVTFAGSKGTYGRLVIIDHGGRKSSYYAHCSSLLVSSGQKVFKGQKIALVGSTGYSTGPHLHFEIRIGGTPVNPLNYVGL